MKTILSIFCFFLCLHIVGAQASTIVQKNITTQDLQNLALNLNAKKIEIKETRGSRILIEMKVTISMPNESMLKYLVSSGRYELVEEIDASTATLRLARKPNLNVLVVRGEECTEDLEFTIYLPSNIKFASDMGETASNR